MTSLFKALLLCALIAASVMADGVLEHSAVAERGDRGGGKGDWDRGDKGDWDRKAFAKDEVKVPVWDFSNSIVPLERATEGIMGADGVQMTPAAADVQALIPFPFCEIKIFARQVDKGLVLLEFNLKQFFQCSFVEAWFLDLPKGAWAEKKSSGVAVDNFPRGVDFLKCATNGATGFDNPVAIYDLDWIPPFGTPDVTLLIHNAQLDWKKSLPVAFHIEPFFIPWWGFCFGPEHLSFGLAKFDPKDDKKDHGKDRGRDRDRGKDDDEDDVDFDFPPFFDKQDCRCKCQCRSPRRPDFDRDGKKY